MWDSFLLYALLAGIGIACVTGPLGCFIVWRQMAYFGDTLSHSAILGVTLGILLQIDLTLSILVVCLILGLALAFLQYFSQLNLDTLLGILAHASLSLGLVTLSLMTSTVRIDLMAYLFGDLLAISTKDLLWIYCGGAVLLWVLYYFWSPLLSVTVNEELAKVEGIATERIKIILLVLISLLIAIAMKFVGALIITALLIIPAATARKLSSSPEKMALYSSIIGIVAVIGGLQLSIHYDTPTGPSIVVVASLIFLFSNLLPKRY